jgi:hypothetical protein
LSVHELIRAAFPTKSPTVGFTWASATLIRRS